MKNNLVYFDTILTQLHNLYILCIALRLILEYVVLTKQLFGINATYCTFFQIQHCICITIIIYFPCSAKPEESHPTSNGARLLFTITV